MLEHVDSVGLKMAFGASPYSYTAGEWMFEQREAVPTPLGGGTIAYSIFTYYPTRSPGPVARYPLLSVAFLTV
jgi:hypothetical protein